MQVKHFICSLYLEYFYYFIFGVALFSFQWSTVKHRLKTDKRVAFLLLLFSQFTLSNLFRTCFYQLSLITENTGIVYFYANNNKIQNIFTELPKLTITAHQAVMVKWQLCSCLQHVAVPLTFTMPNGFSGPHIRSELSANTRLYSEAEHMSTVLLKTEWSKALWLFKLE